MERVRLYTPPPQEPWSVPVLAFNVEGVPSEAVGEFLAKGGVAVRCGLHCAPAAHEKMGTLETGAVRVSLSAFTHREDLDALAFSPFPLLPGNPPGGPLRRGNSFCASCAKSLLFVQDIC